MVQILFPTVSTQFLRPNHVIVQCVRLTTAARTKWPEHEGDNSGTSAGETQRICGATLHSPLTSWCSITTRIPLLLCHYAILCIHSQLCYKRNPPLHVCCSLHRTVRIERSQLAERHKLYPDTRSRHWLN